MWFVLGVVVGLLIGWFIWARGQASHHHSHDGHDHAHDHSAPSETKTDTAPVTPLMSSGDAIAPTGVPSVGAAPEPEPVEVEPAETPETPPLSHNPAVEPSAQTDEAREGVGTGPFVDEAAREKARAIGIAPAAAGARGDDLTRIKGVGPKLQAMLHGLGVYTFAQIAAWSDEEIERVDANLTAFKGRVKRDDWRAQAADLA